MPGTPCADLGALTVVNTHWDHESAQSRLESAKLLLDRSDEALRLTPTAVLVLGDLNEAAPTSVPPPFPRPTSAAYNILVSGPDRRFADAVDLRVGGQVMGPVNSFVGFYHDGPPGGGRVDHVLVRTAPGVAVAVPLAGIVPTDDDRGALPSDHRPVVADVLLASSASGSEGARVRAPTLA